MRVRVQVPVVRMFGSNAASAAFTSQPCLLETSLGLEIHSYATQERQQRRQHLQRMQLLASR